MRKIILITGLLLYSCLSFGQLWYAVNYNDTLKRQILSKTSEFDSVVCININRIWFVGKKGEENRRLNGFAFAGDKTYRLSIYFKAKSSQGDSIYIDRVEKEAVHKKYKIESIRNFNYGLVCKLSNAGLDSTSRKISDSVIELPASDLYTYTFVSCNNRADKITVKQAYGLEMYQYTSAQRIFKKKMEEFEALLK
jgi:hypothetical protein